MRSRYASCRVFRGGASSYLDRLSRPATKGADTRLDVATHRSQSLTAPIRLSCSPNWSTMDRVVKKRLDGFVVEFSEPAPERATVDWPMAR